MARLVSEVSNPTLSCPTDQNSMNTMDLQTDRIKHESEKNIGHIMLEYSNLGDDKTLSVPYSAENEGEIAILARGGQTNSKQRDLELAKDYEASNKGQVCKEMKIANTVQSMTGTNRTGLKCDRTVDCQLKANHETVSTFRRGVSNEYDYQRCPNGETSNSSLGFGKGKNDQIQTDALINTIANSKHKDKVDNESVFSLWKSVPYPKQPKCNTVSPDPLNNFHRRKRVAVARGIIVQKLKSALENNFLLKYSSTVMNLMKEAFVLSVRSREEANLSHVDPIKTILTCKNFNLAAWTILYVISASSLVAAGLEKRSQIESSRTDIWKRTAQEIRCVASYVATGRDQMGKFLHWARSMYSPVSQTPTGSNTSDAPHLISTPGNDPIDEVLSMTANMMFFSNLSSKDNGSFFNREERIAIFKIGSLLTFQHYSRSKSDGISFFTPMCLDKSHSKLVDTLAHMILVVQCKTDDKIRAQGLRKISDILDSFPLKEFTKQSYPVPICYLLMLFTNLMKIKASEVSAFMGRFRTTHSEQSGPNQSVADTYQHVQQRPHQQQVQLGSNQQQNETQLRFPGQRSTPMNGLCDAIQLQPHDKHIYHENTGKTWGLSQSGTLAKCLPKVDIGLTQDLDGPIEVVSKRMEWRSDCPTGPRDKPDASISDLSPSAIEDLYNCLFGPEGVSLPSCVNSIPFKPQTVQDQFQPVLISTYVQKFDTNTSVAQLPSSTTGSDPLAGGQDIMNSSRQDQLTMLYAESICGPAAKTCDPPYVCDDINSSQRQDAKTTNAPEYSGSIQADRQSCDPQMQGAAFKEPSELQGLDASTIACLLDENCKAKKHEHLFPNSSSQENSIAPDLSKFAESENDNSWKGVKRTAQDRLLMNPAKRQNLEVGAQKPFYTHKTAQIEGKDVLEELFEMFDFSGISVPSNATNSKDHGSYTHEMSDAAPRTSMPEDRSTTIETESPDVICISDEEETH